MNVQQIGKRIVVLIKEMFVQLFSGDDPATVLGQVLDECQFARSERHGDAGFGHGVRSQIDQHIVYANDRRCIACCTTYKSADSRKQFREFIGFREIIIRTRVQSPNPVRSGAPRRQDEDRSLFF